MAVSPLRRMAGFTGLLCVGAIGVMLVAGSLTIQEAAIRAGIAMAAVVILGRIIGGLVSVLADSVDRQLPQDTTANSESPTHESELSEVT